MELPLVIALVTGATQALKMAFKIPSRFVPLISIAFGVGFIALGDVTVQDIIITGITVGLASSGLYDISKKTVLNK
jgi:hypothetical protein